MTMETKKPGTKFKINDLRNAIDEAIANAIVDIEEKMAKEIDGAFDYLITSLPKIAQVIRVTGGNSDHFQGDDDTETWFFDVNIFTSNDSKRHNFKIHFQANQTMIINFKFNSPFFTDKIWRKDNALKTTLGEFVAGRVVIKDNIRLDSIKYEPAGSVYCFKIDHTA